MSKPKVHRPEPVQYDDGIETNLYGIAEQICSRPPQFPCTIQLVMDHDVADSADVNDFEFDLLRTFTLACLKIKFGAETNPFDLTETQLDLLQRYINSIGYTLMIDKEETDTSYKFTMSYKRYGQSSTQINPLEHLRKHMS